MSGMPGKKSNKKPPRNGCMSFWSVRKKEAIRLLTRGEKEKKKKA